MDITADTTERNVRSSGLPLWADVLELVQAVYLQSCVTWTQVALVTYARQSMRLRYAGLVAAAPLLYVVTTKVVARLRRQFQSAEKTNKAKSAAPKRPKYLCQLLCEVVEMYFPFMVEYVQQRRRRKGHTLHMALKDHPWLANLEIDLLYRIPTALREGALEVIPLLLQNQMAAFARYMRTLRQDALLQLVLSVSRDSIGIPGVSVDMSDTENRPLGMRFTALQRMALLATMGSSAILCLLNQQVDNDYYLSLLLHCGVATALTTCGFLGNLLALNVDRITPGLLRFRILDGVGKLLVWVVAATGLVDAIIAHEEQGYGILLAAAGGFAVDVFLRQYFKDRRLLLEQYCSRFLTHRNNPRSHLAHYLAFRFFTNEIRHKPVQEHILREGIQNDLHNLMMTYEFRQMIHRYLLAFLPREALLAADGGAMPPLEHKTDTPMIDEWGRNTSRLHRMVRRGLLIASMLPFGFFGSTLYTSARWFVFNNSVERPPWWSYEALTFGMTPVAAVLLVLYGHCGSRAAHDYAVLHAITPYVSDADMLGHVHTMLSPQSSCILLEDEVVNSKGAEPQILPQDVVEAMAEFLPEPLLPNTSPVIAKDAAWSSGEVPEDSFAAAVGEGIRLSGYSAHELALWSKH